MNNGEMNKALLECWLVIKECCETYGVETKGDKTFSDIWKELIKKLPQETLLVLQPLLNKSSFKNSILFDINKSLLRQIEQVPVDTPISTN